MINSKKDRDLLIRIDEQLKALHSCVDGLKQDVGNVKSVVDTLQDIVLTHTTYFKIAGWILGSSTVIGVFISWISK